MARTFFTPFWRPFLCFQGGFSKILSLCRVSIQEWSLHKSRLWSRPWMKSQHRAQCTEEAEREVGGGCTNIMMTEKLWSGRNDRRHYSCSICEMEKWPPDKWPRLLAVQWLAHHHMYVLSDTGQYGKFQVGYSKKHANMVTSGSQFCRSLLELEQAEM